MLLAGVLAVLAVQPFSCAAADSYEWEDGTIFDTGTEVTQVVTLEGASGGKAVSLLDAGDSVTLDVKAAAAGAYTLGIRYSQPYDEKGKMQNVLINGDSAGSVSCDYTGEGKFKTANVTAVLKAGSNKITIESSWGWTYLDVLTVTPWKGGTVSSDAALSNPKASQKAQSLYAFLCDTYGKNVIAGQQESTWMGSEDYEFNIIQNASGNCLSSAVLTTWARIFQAATAVRKRGLPKAALLQFAGTAALILREAIPNPWWQSRTGQSF